MTDEDELLSVKQVAAMTPFTVKGLYSRRDRGQPPESFNLGRRVVYRRSAVKAWIDAQEMATAKGG